jgi:hypothetical protein
MTGSGLLGGGIDRAAASPADAVPPSPRAARLRRPSSLDVRLVVGVLLVLGSAVLGARVVAAADRTSPVWAVRDDLAAGTTLSARDLVAVRLRVTPGADRYLSTERSAAGLALTRDVGAGELLPEEAVRGRPVGSLVGVPVSLQHVPSTIRAGQRIDVYATIRAAPRRRPARRGEQAPDRRGARRPGTGGRGRAAEVRGRGPGGHAAVRPGGPGPCARGWAHARGGGTARR